MPVMSPPEPEIQTTPGTASGTLLADTDTRPTMGTECPNCGSRNTGGSRVDGVSTHICNDCGHRWT
ncbi:MAG: hypothetical protein J2P25_14465 [Nocardiopsaceae bacterium]|nr:hypothetical protein [Nocardiopsaceae bacterium]